MVFRKEVQSIHQAVQRLERNARRAQQRNHKRRRDGSINQQSVNRRGDDKRDSGTIPKAAKPKRSHEVLFRQVAEQASNAEWMRKTRRRYHQPDAMA